MRVLLVSSREKGHLHPMRSVASGLVAAGHDVGWLVLPRPPADLDEPGVKLFALDEAFSDLVTAGPELAALVRDPERLAPWVRRLLVDDVPAQVPGVARALQAFRPDVVATDPMVYAAAIAADEAQVPWIGLSSSLNPVVPDTWDSALLRTTRALDAARRALLPVDFRVSDALSPLGTGAWTTAALVGPPPPGVRLLGRVGRAVCAPPPEAPFLYGSFGSQISWQPDAFCALADAARQLGLRPVFAAGALVDDPEFRSRIGDAVLLRDAPQLALLAHASVFVSHGGANSVMEALTACTPLALWPVCNDQPHNTRFVVEAGAGVEVTGLSGPALVEALAATMSDPRIGRARRAISDDYIQHIGEDSVEAWLAEL